MRLWQIFDAGPRFGRFWRVFLTQILTREGAIRSRGFAMGPAMGKALEGPT